MKILAGMTLVATVAACREPAPPRWRDERRVPAGAVAALTRCLDGFERILARDTAEVFLQGMVNDDWHHGDDLQGIRYWFRDLLEDYTQSLCAEPRRRRFAKLRLMTRGQAIGRVYGEAEKLAYRRIAIDHPEVPAALGTEDAEMYQFSSAPPLGLAEIEGRARELEIELEDVIARYRDAVTPYVECTRHLSDGDKQVRALLRNAHGQLGQTTGSIHWMLERVAPHIPTGAAIPWDDGQPYGWPSCPEPR